MIIIWLILALVAITAAIMVITLDNPVHSALALVLTLLCVAGMYVMLNASFVAIIQVAVYAGAIMVLFLYVVMLLNLRAEEGAVKSAPYSRAVGLVLALVVVLCLASSIASNVPNGPYPLPRGDNTYTFGSPQEIGTALFHTYLYPFEAVSLLLTVALVGAILLGRRKF